MATFAKFVHDFGLLATSRNDWVNHGEAYIRQLVDEAGHGWWRETLSMLLVDGVTDAAYARVQRRARRVPKWLLCTSQRHYLNAIPRDIRNIIYSYLQKTEIKSHGSGIYKMTMFFGVLHSFCDRPAYVFNNGGEISYRWYKLGQPYRACGRPRAICITRYRDILTWNNNRTLTRHRNKKDATGDSASTYEGSDNAMELVIAHFMRKLHRYAI